MMARAGAIYPQVDAGAIRLAHRAFVRCASTEPVSAALRLAARRRARLLVVSDNRAAGVSFPAVLRRAAALGLDHHPVGSFTFWEIPALSGQASEIEVRRRLLEGAPAVLVRERGDTAGVIEPSFLGRPAPPFSLVSRLERQAPTPVIELLRAAGLLGETLGIPVFLAGGFVRDLLLGRPPLDLDLVAEGDGTVLARRLARQIGGRLSLHRSFGTATLRGGPTGVLDVATARRERYPVPGILPVVSRASILEDLRRRDFTVNAMAISLAPSSFGTLLDPVGGLNDLRRRRIRALHPLSFIEDPTRIFRAVRYAKRLGFGLDRNSRRWVRLALRAGPYPALSGQRIMAELRLIAGEPRPVEILIALGRLGAFRLLDPAYRFAPIAALRLRELSDFVSWAGEHQLAVADLSLFMLVLVSHLDDDRAERILRRLALSGEPRLLLMRARTEGPSLVERLTRAEAPSHRARWLRGQPAETLGWTWLLSPPVVRRRLEWFLTEAQEARSRLGGEDLLALGVPRGPAVGALLDRLRDARLDGGALTREEEIALVRGWMDSPAGGRVAAPETQDAPTPGPH
jgi:tRNA nucleotidyltransferase (CCA-adding enzyme)